MNFPPWLRWSRAGQVLGACLLRLIGRDRLRAVISGLTLVAPPPPPQMMIEPCRRSRYCGKGDGHGDDCEAPPA